MPFAVLKQLLYGALWGMMKTPVLFCLLCVSAMADLASGKRAFDSGDYATALKEFLPLAGEGDADAQCYLGMMYRFARGVSQDHREALKWFRLAAAQANPTAQLFLGVMNETGQGVPQDYKAAVEWYRLAAGVGLGLAQIFLGQMYEKGQGVPQDYVQAHMWFNLAGVTGNTEAIRYRDSVAQKMTAEQLAEAQRLAREYKPKTKPRL